MKTLIKVVEFDSIHDTVTLFVQCRFIVVSNNFFQYMKNSLCTCKSGLRKVGNLVWLFNEDNAYGLKGLDDAYIISHRLQLR